MLRIRIAVAWRLEYDDVLYTIPVPVRGFGRGPATRGRARGDGERERGGPGLALLGESVGVRAGERGLYGCGWAGESDGVDRCPGVLCEALPVKRGIEMVRGREDCTADGIPLPNCGRPVMPPNSEGGRDRRDMLDCGRRSGRGTPVDVVLPADCVDEPELE